MAPLGIIGSGNIGSALARLAVASGGKVVMANSRGPGSLGDLISELGPAASAGTVEQAAGAGEVVVVSVPLFAVRSLPAGLLAGKVVLDTSNYYPFRDGRVAELDSESMTTSELVREWLGGVRLVKAFNNILAHHIPQLARPSGAADRTALPLASDDGAANRVAAELAGRLGFEHRRCGFAGRELAVRAGSGGLHQVVRGRPGDSRRKTNAGRRGPGLVGEAPRGIGHGRAGPGSRPALLSRDLTPAAGLAPGAWREGQTVCRGNGVAQLGRLDIMLANAGISTPAPTLKMDELVWDEMIEINLTGQWKTIRAAVPHIIAGGRGGSVVITSSLAAIYANPNTAHYSAAKVGLIMLMKVLAKELAPHSIRVNTIHPTTVATDMILNEPTYRLFRPDLASPTREDFEEAARTLNKLPVAALEPADISNAILYLVSDAGRYVTGITHVLDAGGQL